MTPGRHCLVGHSCTAGDLPPGCLRRGRARRPRVAPARSPLPCGGVRPLPVCVAYAGWGLLPLSLSDRQAEVSCPCRPRRLPAASTAASLRSPSSSHQPLHRLGSLCRTSRFPPRDVVAPLPAIGGLTQDHSLDQPDSYSSLVLFTPALTRRINRHPPCDSVAPLPAVWQVFPRPFSGSTRPSSPRRLPSPSGEPPAGLRAAAPRLQSPPRPLGPPHPCPW